jgi:hypothetical protein
MFAKRGRKAIRKPVQGALPKQITSLVSFLLITVKKFLSTKQASLKSRLAQLRFS